MLLSEFIGTYATATGTVLTGLNDDYTVHMVSIAGIMSSMESCDSYGHFDDFEQSWAELFLEKREDRQYPALVESIRDNGILTPFCIAVEDDGDGAPYIYAFHNGNHRLAAAVELGYTHVPIVFVSRHDYEDKWHVTQLGGRHGADWAYSGADECEASLSEALIEPVLLPDAA